MESSEHNFVNAALMLSSMCGFALNAQDALLSASLLVHADGPLLFRPAQTQSFMKPWVCGTTGIPVQYTPYGRSWNINDGTMGTTATAVFLANVYGQVGTAHVVPQNVEPVGQSSIRAAGDSKMLTESFEACVLVICDDDLLDGSKTSILTALSAIELRLNAEPCNISSTLGVKI